MVSLMRLNPDLTNLAQTAAHITPDVVNASLQTSVVIKDGLEKVKPGKGKAV